MIKPSSVVKSEESLEETPINILDEVKNELKNELKNEVKNEVTIEKDVDTLHATESKNIISQKELVDNVSIDFEIEDLTNNDVLEENSKELQELDMDLKMDTLEPLTLKKPNQVYFDLYKEARNKAKLAKKNAILAYLEAKNIKKTFMLDNLNDSDSDFDNEIDEISESELEGL